MRVQGIGPPGAARLYIMPGDTPSMRAASLTFMALPFHKKKTALRRLGCHLPDWARARACLCAALLFGSWLGPPNSSQVGVRQSGPIEGVNEVAAMVVAQRHDVSRLWRE
jgi:hypothetical protein